MGPGLWEEAWWPQLSYLASLLAGENHRADPAVGGDARSTVLSSWCGVEPGFSEGPAWTLSVSPLPLTLCLSRGSLSPAVLWLGLGLPL